MAFLLPKRGGTSTPLRFWPTLHTGTRLRNINQGFLIFYQEQIKQEVI